MQISLKYISYRYISYILTFLSADSDIDCYILNCDCGLKLSGKGHIGSTKYLKSLNSV